METTNKQRMAPVRTARSTDGLRLPFGQKRRTDPANWIYKHRIGILTTLIIHLVIIIIFLTYQIIIHPVPLHSSIVEIPDEQLDELLQPEEEKKQEVEVLENMENIAKAKNRISDVNAELDASLKDHRHKDVQKIYDEAEAVQKSLAEGAAAYKKAMAELEAMENEKPVKAEKKQENTSDEKKNVKHQGNVTVSYDLEGRTDVFLYIPAYKCEGSGIVVVAIAVDRNGNVTHAAVNATSSPDDNCINEMAIYAAKSSKFSISQTAPNPQKGTIKYQFEAQR